MMDELFAPLYEKIPDSGEYLKRIGIDAFEKPDKAALDALILAHLQNVPFENIDVYDANAEISIGIPDLYDKIVLRRRGGYCFELNSAFIALLQSLGFECYAIAVRIMWGRPWPMPITHKAGIVTIDGKRYYCDVGFGGPSPQGALALDGAGPQKSGSNVFVVEKNGRGTEISRLINDEGEKEVIFEFLEAPVEAVDFLAPNEWQSQNKHSMFRNVRLCNRVTKSGATTLSGNILKVHSGGDVTEISLDTESKFREALKEHFGIEGGFPLRL